MALFSVLSSSTPPLFPGFSLLSYSLHSLLYKLAFYCELFQINSKAFLLPAKSTAQKGPKQQDAFSGRQGQEWEEVERGVRSLSLLQNQQCCHQLLLYLVIQHLMVPSRNFPSPLSPVDRTPPLPSNFRSFFIPHPSPRHPHLLGDL